MFDVLKKTLFGETEAEKIGGDVIAERSDGADGVSRIKEPCLY